MATIYFSGGIPTGPRSCSIVLQPVDADAPDEQYDSHVLEWAVDRAPRVRALDFQACSGACLQNEVFILGRLGEVARVQPDTITREDIDGPETHGNLVSLRRIGNRLFACGIARQVYERDASGNWLRADQGLLDETSPVGTVTGLRDLDGAAPEDIYAVGLEGEIWNRSASRWRALASPTNVILEQVRAVDSETLYAVGQHGLILRGRSESWAVIEQGETEADFWGLELFNRALYLCTASQLFRLNAAGELEALKLPGAPATHLSRLRAGFDTLWLFGATRFFWTTDGSTWHEGVVAPPAG